MACRAGGIGLKIQCNLIAYRFKSGARHHPFGEIIYCYMSCTYYLGGWLSWLARRPYKP